MFRGGSAFVLVDVYPQQDGRVVEGLTADEFQVFEDGKPQKVESFEFVRIEPSRNEAARRDPNNSRDAFTQAAIPSNRLFIIYLDKNHVTIAGAHNIRKPLIDMLNALIAPDDLFGVITPEIEPRHIILGRRMLGVEEQLTRHWPWGERHRLTTDPLDPGEAWMEVCFGGHKSGLTREFIDRRREDKTLTSLENLTAFLGAIREARTVVIPITDGWRLYRPDPGLVNMGGGGDPPPIVNRGGKPGIGTGLSEYSGPGSSSCSSEAARLAALDNDRRFRDVIALANRNNVSFYPVTPAGLAVFDTPLGVTPSIRDPQDATEALVANVSRVAERVGGLKTLAHNTDGIAIVDTNDLSAGLKRIVNDVSAYHLLGYYTTNTRLDGRFRRIEVKTSRRDVDIKARRGYVAPMPPSEKPASTPTPARTTPALPDEAFHLLARLRSGAEMFTYAVAEADAVHVSVELARGKVGSAPRPVRVAVANAAGESIATASATVVPPVRGASIRVPLPAGATGPFKVVVDIEGGAGRLQEQLSVEPASARLIGEPRVSRATSSPRSPLWAVADFQFTRTERVHIEWRLRETLDRREVRLLGRDGKPLPVPVAATEREQDGARVLAVDVQLSPLTAGDYVIEVSVGAGTDTDKRFVPIRITG